MGSGCNALWYGCVWNTGHEGSDGDALASTCVLPPPAYLVPLSRLQAFVGQHLEHQDVEAMTQQLPADNYSFDSKDLDHMGLNLQWSCHPETVLGDMQVRSVSTAAVVPTAIVAATPLTVESTNIILPAAVPTLSDGLQLSSVLKKRHRKMKRHKYKKWRKKMASERRKK